MGVRMVVFELNNHLNTKVSDHWHTGLYLHGNVRNMQMDNNGDGFMDVPTGSQINLMNRWQYANPNTGWMSNLTLHYLYDARKAGLTLVCFCPNSLAE